MGVVAPILSIGSSVLGGIMGAAGASEEASAQAAASNYQAQVSQNNTVLANRQAQLTMAAGEQKAYATSMQARQQVGQTRAALGASGVDVNTGSAANVIQSEQKLGQLNSMTQVSNSANQAYGYQVQATSDTAQGQLYSMQAKQAQTAGMFGAMSSLLSGASGAAKSYEQWQSATGGNNTAIFS